MGEVGKGLNYVKSPGGLLKLAELALLMIAAGTVGYFYREDPDGDYKKKDSVKFFLAAAGIAAIVVVVFFLIFLSGLHKKVKIVWTKTATGVFVLVGVILLVASAMLAEAYKINKDDKFCDFLEHLPGSKKDCKHVLVGLVFGFVSAVVFIVDAVVHFKM